MAISVRMLRPTDDRASFESGNEDLDRFFVRHAGQNQFRHYIGTTYVAVEGDEIVGFATVAACSIEAVGLPKRKRKGLPAYPLPALRLARMAVARARQRQGIGALLLKAVFLVARQQAKRAGCAFVVVDAKPGAEPFYARFGFEPVAVTAGELDVRPIPTVMFLEVGAIPDRGDDLIGGPEEG